MPAARTARPIRPLTFLSLAIVVCSAELLACAPMTPLVPHEFEGLAPDEGIVLFFIESNRSLQEISIAHRQKLRGIMMGSEVRVMVARAGSYRWDGAVEPRPMGSARFRFQWDDSARFEVEAGKVNYPGHLSLTFAGNVLYVRVLNRSSEALDYLENSEPWLLDAFPVTFSGSSRDDFLVEFQRLLRAHDQAEQGASDGTPAGTEESGS